MFGVLRKLQSLDSLSPTFKGGLYFGQDLAAGNVLLAAAPDLPQGFRAKLGDFGLSRQLLEVRSRITTNSYGCINYLAPEVITEGRLSKVILHSSMPGCIYVKEPALWCLLAFLCVKHGWMSTLYLSYNKTQGRGDWCGKGPWWNREPSSRVQQAVDRLVGRI